MQSRSKSLRLTTSLLAVLVLSACSDSGQASSDDSFQIETVTDGLNSPWGMTFLPASEDFALLVTERPGNLLYLDPEDGSTHSLQGLPEVAVVGQGGLLDIALHPDFAEGDNWVYLTFAAQNPNGSGYATHMGRGRLNLDNLRLEDWELLYAASPYSTGNGHFGSRLAFDDQGYLYMTIGDRRERDAAQDLQSNWGKTLRFHADGSIPTDNPFVGDDQALDAIYTYGHRNVQAWPGIRSVDFCGKTNMASRMVMKSISSTNPVVTTAGHAPPMALNTALAAP